jgi:hypothetical protein
VEPNRELRKKQRLLTIVVEDPDATNEAPRHGDGSAGGGPQLVDDFHGSSIGDRKRIT